MSALFQARLERDVLVLDEIVQSRQAIQTTKTGLLESAFLSTVVDLRPVIDPHRASFKRLRDAQRSIDIASPNASRESVFIVVGELNRVRLIRKSLDRSAPDQRSPLG